MILLKTFITIFTNFLSDLFSFSSAHALTLTQAQPRVQHFYFSEKQLIINLCISEIKKKIIIEKDKTYTVGQLVRNGGKIEKI